MISSIKNFKFSKKRMLGMLMLTLLISAFSFGCSKSSSSTNNDGPNGINPADYSYYMGIVKNTDSKDAYSIMFFSEKVLIDSVELKINNEEVELEDMFSIWGNLSYDFTGGETYSFEVTINGSKDVETLEMKIPGAINVNWPETIDFSVDNTFTWTLTGDPMMQVFDGESYNYVSGDVVDKEVDLDVSARSYNMKADWLPNDTVDNTLSVEADNYHSGSKMFSMAISTTTNDYNKKSYKEFINDMKKHIVKFSKSVK